MTRFASLTAGLLARKGAAEPLATPFADPMLTRVGANGPDLREYSSSGVSGGSVRHLALNSAFGRRSVAAGLETAYADCGSLPPLAAPDVAREEEIVQTQCDAVHTAVGDDPLKTFHVNLRLKRPRFVKLKLSAALLRRPAQDIVSEALDQWFEKLPAHVLGDCSCMKSGGD